MSWIAELLPLCFVRWYSNWVLERYRDNQLIEHVPKYFANPRPGIWVEVDP